MIRESFSFVLLFVLWWSFVILLEGFDLVEKSVLTHFINGVEKKKVCFSRVDMKQVTEGLRYAAVRDSVADRKKHYGLLNKKFWGLMH